MQKIFLTSSFSQVADKLPFGLIDRAKDLKVAFIPTAGDRYQEKPWMDADRDKLKKVGFSVVDVDLKNKSEAQLRDELKDKDIIFVAGGDTCYLLDETKKSGFDKIVVDLVNKGIVYIGSSAGSILAGPSVEPFLIDEEYKSATLTSFNALNLVNFIILPHYNKEKYNERNDAMVKEFKKKFKFITITDSQAVIYDGEIKMI